MNFNYERVPRWILAVTVIGTPIAGITAGPWGALGFLLGSLGSWWNFTNLVRAVKALARAAIEQQSAEQQSAAPTRAVMGLLLRFFLLAAAVLVILKYSKISLIALLVGLFASCIAIALELVYETVWSTKSG
jgi:hypothetical protein